MGEEGGANDRSPRLTQKRVTLIRRDQSENDLRTIFTGSADGKDDLAWQIALGYHEKKRLLHSSDLKARAREIAAKAILDRARVVVGATKRQAPPERLPYSIAGGGEILIEETLEHLAGLGDLTPRASDIIMELRPQKHVDAVMMLDTSLSMTGRNLALAGVSAAVLALKLPPREYALVVFEGAATVVKRLSEPMSRESAVSKLLEAPAMGYTNIEDALAKGLAELRRGRNRDQIGILITDGVFTEGGDPREIAPKYHRLFVLMTKAYKMNKELCYELASLGHGRCFPVGDYSELPEVMSRLLREALR